MTWSHRVFIPIPLPNQSTSIPSDYQLYKFVDRRDSRNQNLIINLEKNLSIDSSSWCYSLPNDASTTTAVLYVPGHGGSYQQARSLGAHGVQMTRRNLSRQQITQTQKSLLSLKYTGNATDIDDFVYDVFAVHFQEEPTGLHGEFVRSQAEYLSQVTHHLIDSCKFRQIVLVAHSMGGYAAELARIIDPTIRPFVRNMITLATPHGHPSLAWERSLYEIHQRIQHESDDYNLSVVAVSGGIADAMIPARSCDASTTHAASLSILASDIMTTPKDDTTKRAPSLGMDHQAIVWCHNLLDGVRVILHQLAVVHDQRSSTERIVNLKDLYKGVFLDYNEALGKHGEQLRTSFGRRATFMEAALTHQAIWLVSCYCLIAALHCALPVLAVHADTGIHLIQWFCFPLLAVLLCWAASDSNGLSMFTILMLSFTASRIFQIVHWVLNRFVAARWAAERLEAMNLIAISFIPLTLVVVTVASKIIFSIKQSRQIGIGLNEVIALSAVLLVYALSLIMIGMLPCPPKQDTRLASTLPKLPKARYTQNNLLALYYRRPVLVALILPILPVLLAGDVAVIWHKGVASLRNFLILLAPLICWILLCFILDPLPRSYGRGLVGKLVMLLRTFTVAKCGVKLFRLEHPAYGSGFASGCVEILIQLVQLEILEMLVVWFLGRQVAGKLKKA
ncbi:hypothetical protein MPSEU_000105400 [Mayamaea pseudoterrestris]|nr:hypothetical protein MPSEU_000105400 [Mayamaea pseudoterrestris]